MPEEDSIDRDEKRVRAFLEKLKNDGKFSENDIWKVIRSEHVEVIAKKRTKEILQKLENEGLVEKAGEKDVIRGDLWKKRCR